MAENRKDEYFIVGNKAVKFVKDNDGMDVLVYEKKTGQFVRDMSYLSKAIYGYESEEVTEDEFNKFIASLKND